MVAAWNNKRKLEAMSQQLIRSERYAVIGQVARGIGHELGNVLLRIMGKVDLALLEKDPSKIITHLQVAMKAAERAGVIIRNLQSFSKSEPTYQHESVVVPLEESIAHVSHELAQASIKLEKDFKEVPALKIDTGGLAQVFLNLLINAIHAMPKGGTIQVTVEQAAGPETIGGPCVVARLADTGGGILRDILPRFLNMPLVPKGIKEVDWG